MFPFVKAVDAKSTRDRKYCACAYKIEKRDGNIFDFMFQKVLFNLIKVL